MKKRTNIRGSIKVPLAYFVRVVNTMLNYGYSLLEAECLRAINSVGLDPHVGFLHEMTPSKNSLTYDLQEPFRFLVDLAVISLIESGAMESKDFIRTKLQSQVKAYRSQEDC